MKRGMVKRGTAVVREKKRAPADAPIATTLEVPLFPRSASILLDMLENERNYFEREKPYVVIDLDNFRNQLRAHLQRVAIGH